MTVLDERRHRRLLLEQIRHLRSRERPRGAQTARRAMKLASRADNNAVYNAIRDELPLYELGLPYHETAKTP